MTTEGFPPSPSPRVLVADDEPAVRKMLEAALRLDGFDVWLAAGGQEAVDLYRQHSSAIDVVLLDVQMPDLDGPHSLEAFRSINPAVRCCFMSGHTGRYSQEDLLKMGAAAILQKPLQLAETANVLRQLVDSE